MWIVCCGKPLFSIKLNEMLTGFSDVKGLVGELDFSFHAVSTMESAKSSVNVSRLSRASSLRDKSD